jgi:hypothetical protein
MKKKNNNKKKYEKYKKKKEERSFLIERIHRFLETTVLKLVNRKK